MSLSAADRLTVAAGDEPIPGYVLEELIGRGGFGEVWRCNAPGNLKKAIKFVFGDHDDAGAQRERRSLERVRTVRHPFLLTLERFEIVRRQLVVVTELADGSLEDVYVQYRKDQSCGIPREFLLRHLADAADGLDYLHEEFQLQHLDIKPANLLMVGGHVKVADFGLLKDLRDVDCSIIGGLTPVYAPPELFDGQPSRHSDQYSLAVMYQEMLTGTRPFGGRTIAQLATQHVHTTPNLEPLPARDRAVIAKALEKDPTRRFDSCIELAEALKAPRPVVISSSPAKPAGGPVQIEDLPAVDDTSPNEKPSAIRSTHAIVVGLGGCGAEVIRDLRQRSASHNVGCPVLLSPILVDIDEETIHAATIGEDVDRNSKCNAIHTPMKTSHEYRRNTTGKFRSISRRWIYNVPRSGRAEGLRTMGRLALLDHSEAVFKVIAAQIDAHDSSNGDLHVYVAASIGGATGGGMYLDIVHQIRTLLDSAGHHDVKILSMLATPPLRISKTQPIPAHNAHATLIEINHFLDAGNGYPGDAGAGLASVPAARTPLRDAYLICGESRLEASYAEGRGEEPASSEPSAASTAANYIWADAASGGELLARARHVDTNANDPTPPVPGRRGATIRSVGVVTVGESHFFEEQMLAPPVMLAVLKRWLGRTDVAPSEVSAAAERISRRVGLSTSSVMSTLLDAVGISIQARRGRLRPSR